MFTSAEDADTFITDFERQNYTQTSGYFQLPQTGASYSIQTKDLNDFTNTYLNEDGVTEILAPYEFQLAQDSVITYLRVFTFVELDTKTLESDLNMEQRIRSSTDELPSITIEEVQKKLCSKTFEQNGYEMAKKIRLL